MRTKVLYNEYNDGYQFVIKESTKSFILCEYIPIQGEYDKEIRYHKTPKMRNVINDFIGGNVDFGWFRDNFLLKDNSSYWQSWKYVY